MFPRIRLDPEGTSRYADLTRTQIGRCAILAVDGMVILRAKISVAVEGSRIAVPNPPAAQVETMAPRLLDGRSHLTIRFETP